MQGHKIALCLVFPGTPILFSTVVHHLHSHQDCRGIPFSVHALQYLFFVELFSDGCCDQCVVIPHCSFDGIDLIIVGVEYLSMCLCYFTPCEYSLPLETGFLKGGSVWNSSPMIYRRTFLESGVIHSPVGLLTIKRPSAPVSWCVY